MRMRSTGLGKTELQADIVDIQRTGDFLVLQFQTSVPVKWKVKAAMSHKDLLKLISFMLRWSNLKFVISGFWLPKEPRPTDF